jgi:hypothetical protein
MNSSSSPAPRWFTIFAILALLWNLLGVAAFVMQATLSPEAIAAMPEAEQALYNNYPSWALIAFAVGVFGGLVGSLLLVLKKNLAGPVLWLSLIGVLIQMGYGFLIARSHEVLGPTSVIMPLVVIVIAVYLVMLAAKAKRNGWTS